MDLITCEDLVEMDSNNLQNEAHL